MTWFKKNEELIYGAGFMLSIGILIAYPFIYVIGKSKQA